MPSTVIAKIEYQADHALLVVTFTTGKTYQYFLVPPNVAEEFQRAPSKGGYFNAHIRDRFTCREITRSLAS
jgi:hypothetical protein